ncbi:MAG: hypothetical protein AAGF04_03090 [Chlamydiota bacterium]
MMRIDVKCLMLAVGFGWSVACIIFGITSMIDWGTDFVDVMSSIYIGYRPGIVGAIIGGIWGFGGGAVYGFLIGSCYNYCLGKNNPE